MIVWCVVKTYDDGSEDWSTICDSRETAEAYVRNYRRTGTPAIAIQPMPVTVKTMADVK